jgi:hypothetical protein
VLQKGLLIVIPALPYAFLKEIKIIDESESKI